MRTDAKRHIVISGASSGIGAALARHYASDGQRLTLFGRNAERLDAVAADCSGRGGDVATAIVDVRDRKAVATAVRAADARAPIDHLIANAGIGGRQAVVDAHGEDPEFAAEMVDVNLGGLVACVLATAPQMVGRGRGQITLIGSLAGGIGLPQSPVYSATKAAVTTYGDGLRRQLRGTGVSVTTVLPGFVATPMSRSLAIKPVGLWSAERAAAAIADGVTRGRTVVVFPRYLGFAIRCSAFLPRRAVDFVLAHTNFVTKSK